MIYFVNYTRIDKHAVEWPDNAILTSYSHPLIWLAAINGNLAKKTGERFIIHWWKSFDPMLLSDAEYELLSTKFPE